MSRRTRSAFGPAEKAERRNDFERNETLDALLERLNGALRETREVVLDGHLMPRFPVVFIVGCPRSGTTLFSQWLARSGHFAYPTNLMARFYEAPAVGAMVQRMLTDPALRFRDEFDDVGNRFANEPFHSSIGKTRGVLAPNVFWHFWRRFFPEGDTHRLTEAQLSEVDGAGFASELAAMESVLEAPLAMKAMWIDWHIPFVSDLLDRAVFVDLEREPFFTIQSVLEAREGFFGSRRHWWSFRPPELEKLQTLEPIEQVVGQIHAMRSAVEDGLAALPEERVLHVRYEAFCSDPASTWGRLGDRMAAQGFELPAYEGADRFEHRDTVRLSPEERRQLARAWRERTGEEIAMPSIVSPSPYGSEGQP